MPQKFYKVYIACMTKDSDGCLTKDYMLAKQLYRRLEQKGIHTFLMGKCNPGDRTEALDSASVLIVAGTDAGALLSDTVRNDYDDFIAGVELSGKRRWRVFSYLRGIQQGDLPGYLSGHRSYDYYSTDELIGRIEKTLSVDEPKNCISDEDDSHSEDAFRDMSEPLPESAESAREYDDDDDDYPPVRGRVRARRAPQSQPDEMRIEEETQAEPAPEAYHDEEYHDIMETFRRKEAAPGTGANSLPQGQSSAPLVPPVMPPAPSMPSMPSVPASPKKKKTEKTAKPVKVKPTKVNKVDFSVVAPDEVKPGKSSVIDLLMYTRGQRAIVKRTINQAKEQSSEAARTSSSVSVRQGSRVTALLFSDDIPVADGSRTMIWNGDALDFKFRVPIPDGFTKKEIDFGCCVQFDGIEITRLYFTVPVGIKKKAAIRFTRRDCRRAFVSYSHKDRLRVAEQLLAIQEVAPKLRFWMDNRSMTAGDNWRNAIASAIRNADVFLLFWSVSARESSEVRKEWEYALKLEQSGKRREKRMKNGARFISPVPLDSPSECPPPEELGDLHFGDPSFDSDIENIEKVKVWAVKGKNIKFL